MAAVWARSRAELRARWRAWVGLSLAVGVAAGAVLALAAGARRTGSAYPRLVAAERPPQVNSMGLQGVGARGVTIDPAAVARLPQVAEVTRVRNFIVFDGRTASGITIRDPDYVQASVPLDPAGRAWTARTKLVSGRLADPARADEAVIDLPMAERFGLGVGDGFDLRFVRPGEEKAYFSGRKAPPTAGRTIRLRVVGISAASGAFPPRPQAAGGGFAELTPAFARRYAATLGGPETLTVWLRRGTVEMEGFTRAVERLAGGTPFDTFAARADQGGFGGGRRTERAIGLLVIALWVLAGLGAVTFLLVAGQTLDRSAFLEAAEHPTLQAIGMTRVQLWGVAVTRIGLVAATAAAVALAVAFALSPLFPLGLARVAEPDPGGSFDAVTLGVGAAVLVLALLALGVWPAWRVAGGRSARDAGGRRSALAGALARSSFPVTAVAGVGLALEPGRGRTAVPVRSTVAGAVLGVVALTTALTFGAALDHLLQTPRLFGWNWDVAVGDLAAERDLSAEVVPALRSEPAVAGFAAVGGTLVEGGAPYLPAFGFDPVQGDVGPTVVEGRPPASATEVLVGSKTLRSLGVGLGDEIELRRAVDFGDTSPGGRAQRYRVVGRGVLPETGFAEFGEGFALTLAGVERLDRPANQVWFPLRWADGVDQRAAAERLRARVPVTLNPLQRPADLVNFGRVETMPLVTGGLIACLAVAMLGHLLVSSVRHRRRDLAVLKALGFQRRQVSLTIVWQASTLVTVALAIGVPVGVAAGRWIWLAVAERIGVVPEPVLPAALLALLAAATVLVANLVAAVPAWMAARTRPATVLRSE
jgi:ABC-type lipoprotein release transport system permease subunit